MKKNTSELKDDLRREAEELRQRKPPQEEEIHSTFKFCNPETGLHGGFIFTERYGDNPLCDCGEVTWDEYKR